MQFVNDAILNKSHLIYNTRLWPKVSNYALVVPASHWMKTNKTTNFNTREEHYTNVITSEQLEAVPITYLEFGVWTGISFRYWAENLHHPDSRFYGFDTFTGLPERWKDYDAGYFDVAGETPKVQDNRCGFHKGYLQDTLPEFLKTLNPKSRLVVHFDLDLYGPTLYGLIQLYPFLKSGDVIMFDEFMVLSALYHEFRAFRNFNESIHFALDYKLISAAHRCIQVGLKIVKQ